MSDLNIISIHLTSKDGREVVDKLLAAANAPGALIGRAKNGSAALMFRSIRPHDTVPCIPGLINGARYFELASRDGTARIAICTDCSSTTDGYKWNRDIPHHEIPVTMLTASDVGGRVIKAAFDLGLMWADFVDKDLADAARLARLKSDIDAGRVKFPSEAEKQAEADAQLVAANEGRVIAWSDPWPAGEILAARKRHADRLAKVQASADEIRQAEEDRKLLARVERGELPDYLQRVLDARRRQAERADAA